MTQRAQLPANPAGNTITTLATVFLVVGGLAIIVGLSASVFVATAIMIVGAVFVAIGILGFMLRAALTYWEHESRAQASALYEAITERISR